MSYAEKNIMCDLPITYLILFQLKNQSNFVAMYHVIITFYFCKILIQVTLFETTEKKMTK